MTLKRTIALTSAAALLALLTACGSDDDSDAKGDETTNTDTPETDADEPTDSDTDSDGADAAALAETLGCADVQNVDEADQLDVGVEVTSNVICAYEGTGIDISVMGSAADTASAMTSVNELAQSLGVQTYVAYGDTWAITTQDGTGDDAEKAVVDKIAAALGGQVQLLG